MIRVKLSELLVENPGTELFGITYIDYKKDFIGFINVVKGVNDPPLPYNFVRFNGTRFPEYADDEVGLFVKVPAEKLGMNGITQLYNEDKDMEVEVSSFMEGLSVTHKGKPVKVIKANPVEPQKFERYEVLEAFGSRKVGEIIKTRMKEQAYLEYTGKHHVFQGIRVKQAIPHTIHFSTDKRVRKITEEE